MFLLLHFRRVTDLVSVIFILKILFVEKCNDGEFNAALSAVIKQRTAAFVLQGYFWIALGVLVNAPWVVLIFVLRSDIAYEG
jgi:hypothetical protein